MGLRSTRMTESPRRNILLMYRSLLTGLAFFAPFPAFGISVHISFTFSSTMLQWRSKALMRPSSFLLFRTLMSTCEFARMASFSTESGPVLNISSSDCLPSTQEHLTDVSVLVDRLGLLCTLPCFRHLRPHLLHVLQHHVAVAVKSLNAAQQLLVVPHVDEHLRVRAHGLVQHRERACPEHFLLGLLALLGGGIGFFPSSCRHPLSLLFASARGPH